MGEPAVAAVLKAVRSTFACAHTTSVEPGWCTPPPANHSALNRVVRPMPVRGAAAVAHFADVEAAGVLPHAVGYALNSCRSRACPHPYGHALGRALALLTTHGADRLHRLSALSLCGASFQLGCFHGAVEGSVLRRLVESEEARGRPVAPTTRAPRRGAAAAARARAPGGGGGRPSCGSARAFARRRMAGSPTESAYRSATPPSCWARRRRRRAGVPRRRPPAAAPRIPPTTARRERTWRLYGGVSRGADFCRRAAAPGPCFAYWWPSARVPNVRPAARRQAQGARLLRRRHDGRRRRRRLSRMRVRRRRLVVARPRAALARVRRGAACARSATGSTPPRPTPRRAAWANSAAAERLESSWSTASCGAAANTSRLPAKCARRCRALAPVCGAVVARGCTPAPSRGRPSLGCTSTDRVL